MRGRGWVDMHDPRRPRFGVPAPATRLISARVTSILPVAGSTWCYTLLVLTTHGMSACHTYTAYDGAPIHTQ